MTDEPTEPTRLTRSLDEDPHLADLLRSGREVPEDRLADVASRLGIDAGPGGSPPTGGGHGVAWVGGGLLAVAATIALVLWARSGPARSAAEPAPSSSPTYVTDSAPQPAEPALESSTDDGDDSSLQEESVEASGSTPRSPRAESPRRARDPSWPARSEASLLREARAALDDVPGRTLELCAEHARTHPNGLLREERRALRVEALWALGRREAARRALARFEARHPGSAHLLRLREAVGR